MSFPVIQFGELISLESAGAVAGDAGGSVAGPGSVHEHRNALADLWNGNRRGPFFFRGVLRTPRTNWR